MRFAKTLFNDINKKEKDSLIFFSPEMEGIGGTAI